MSPVDLLRESADHNQSGNQVNRAVTMANIIKKECGESCNCP